MANVWVEIIANKDKQIEELRSLLEELMNENKGYRDAIDRLSDYISNYQIAIDRFHDANKN